MLYESAPLSLYEFEATEGPVLGVEGVSAGAEPAAVEPVGAEASEVDVPTIEPAVPTEAPAEPWAPSQDEWQQNQTALQQSQEALEQLYGVLPQIAPHLFQQPEPQLPELDPFDDSFGQNIAGLIQQTVQQAIQQNVAPVQSFIETQAEERGEQKVKETLASYTDLGTFDQDMTMRVAATLYEQGSDPVRTLRAAAEQVSQYEARLKQQGIEEWKQQMAAATASPQVPAAGLAGVSGNGHETVDDAVRAVIERHRG